MCLRPMCLRPFGLYCSACLGILFVSILCMRCSHFSWYCFISFTVFSAPVFSLIHWFFLYLVLLFQEGVLKISYHTTCDAKYLFFKKSIIMKIVIGDDDKTHYWEF